MSIWTFRNELYGGLRHDSECACVFQRSGLPTILMDVFSTGPWNCHLVRGLYLAVVWDKCFQTACHQVTTEVLYWCMLTLHSVKGQPVSRFVLGIFLAGPEEHVLLKRTRHRDEPIYLPDVDFIWSYAFQAIVWCIMAQNNKRRVLNWTLEKKRKGEKRKSSIPAKPWQSYFFLKHALPK